MANLKRGHRPKSQQIGGIPPFVSQKQAGEKVSVNYKSTQEAKSIQSKAAPEVVIAVKGGHIKSQYKSQLKVDKFIHIPKTAKEAGQQSGVGYASVVKAKHIRRNAAPEVN